MYIFPPQIESVNIKVSPSNIIRKTLTDDRQCQGSIIPSLWFIIHVLFPQSVVDEAPYWLMPASTCSWWLPVVDGSSMLGSGCGDAHLRCTLHFLVQECTSFPRIGRQSVQETSPVEIPFVSYRMCLHRKKEFALSSKPPKEWHSLMHCIARQVSWRI